MTMDTQHQAPSVPSKRAGVLTRIEALKREEARLAAAVRDAVAAGQDTGVPRLAGELREKQDLRAALERGLDDAARSDRDEAVRAGHRAAHEALGHLADALERRQALAAEVDSAAAALRAALGAFRASCTEAQVRVAAACANGLRNAPTHVRQDLTPAISGAVSVTEGGALVAMATMLNELFELQTAEGQHLWGLVRQSIQSGAGHHTNLNRLASFASATEALRARMPDVLTRLCKHMQTEADSLDAATTDQTLQ